MWVEHVKMRGFEALPYQANVKIFETDWRKKQCNKSLDST